MIFKAFKEKSNLKYLNKLLNTRSVAVSKKKIETVGVILNLNEFEDFETFRMFLKSLELKAKNIKIIAFDADEKKINQLWDTFFIPKDFGWKGKIKNTELKTFLDTEFDALISFYKEDILELNLITGLSRANFKIGLSTDDNRLYDLIIDVNPKEFNLFKNELKKYLLILNKI